MDPVAPKCLLGSAKSYLGCLKCHEKEEIEQKGLAGKTRRAQRSEYARIGSYFLFSRGISPVLESLRDKHFLAESPMSLNSAKMY